VTLICRRFINDVGLVVTLICRRFINDVGLVVTLICRRFINDVGLVVTLICRGFMFYLYYLYLFTHTGVQHNDDVCVVERQSSYIEHELLTLQEQPNSPW
jgi:hypothetical protein